MATTENSSQSPQSTHAPTKPSPLASPPSVRKRFPSLPSPLPTRRTRTRSISEEALLGPTLKGTVEFFCRERGHGFILPDSGGEHIFLHISDIDGEFIPKHGDIVTYKLCPIPPKMQKFSAVHVNIVHLDSHTHQKWDAPMSPKHVAPSAID